MPLAVTPYTGMVDTAIRFKTAPPTIWCGIGRTTPWDDENNPPDPTDFVHNPQYLSMTMPEEPIVLKRVDFMGLCVPDANGDILYDTQRYTYVPDDQAVALLARWVFTRASLNYYEKNTAGTVILGVATYRQVTLVSGVIPFPQFAEEDILTPPQIQDWGRLVTIANVKPRTRDPKMRDVLQFVREFRG